MVCDDIRKEEGNKYSLMGVYGSDMVVSELPFKLSKLCFQIYVRTPKSNPIESMEVRVEGLQKDAIVIKAPSDSLIAAKGPHIDPESKQIQFGINFTVSPFEILEERRVTVFVIADRQKLYAGSIKIRLDDQAKSRAKQP